MHLSRKLNSEKENNKTTVWINDKLDNIYCISSQNDERKQILLLAIISCNWITKEEKKDWQLNE